jgi:hypothetical protein
MEVLPFSCYAAGLLHCTSTSMACRPYIASLPLCCWPTSIFIVNIIVFIIIYLIIFIIVIIIINPLFLQIFLFLYLCDWIFFILQLFPFSLF